MQYGILCLLSNNIEAGYKIPYNMCVESKVDFQYSTHYHTGLNIVSVVENTDPAL